MSKVLATGGSGYLAGWAVVQLIDAGHSLRTTLRSLDKQAHVRAQIATEAGETDLGFCVVDVRGVADLHIRAVLAPEAAGQRFIGASDGMWLSKIAEILRSEFPKRSDKIPTRAMPDWVVRLVSLSPLLHYLVAAAKD